MTDLEKLAEHIISAQYSYDTPTQKAELIRAFIDGATAERNGVTHDTPSDGPAFIQTYHLACAKVTLIISGKEDADPRDIFPHCNVFKRLREVMEDMINEHPADINKSAKDDAYSVSTFQRPSND